MTAAVPAPEAGTAPDLRATGERIETLLEAASAGGRVARERAEELVRLVVDLYGAGLERLLEIVHEAGRLDDALLDRLIADDLVASLLAVHGLHPDDVATRVARALDGVRPYLGSHGGDVELVGLSADGRVLLRMLGSCDGCPSSSVTLTLAVETAIRDAAPEVTGIDVEDAAPTPSVIPVTALRSRLDVTPPAGEWTAVAGLGDLASGETRRFAVDDLELLGIRVGADLYAYRDACPACGGSLAGGAVARRLGGTAGDAVLRCPACAAHFDVRRAGRGLDDTDAHLEPVPLLVRDGAVAVGAAEGGARVTGDNPLAVLRRISATRPAPSAEERCEMCAEPISDQHPHVVDLSGRGLMCTCRPCYLLFTAESAQLRYRAVPDRYLSFPGVTLDAREWDELEIPVGLAFFFANSVLGRTVAFYPGPAGATESELPLGAWDRVAEAHPAIGTLVPDVEALIVRMPDRAASGAVFLVPIDRCYELVGALRMVWRGFDGGQEARALLEAFFADLASRSRPARDEAARHG